MNAKYGIVFALFVGAAIDASMSGAVVQALHAKSRPTAYVVGEVDVTNHHAFVNEYVPLAMKALGINASGYKALAVGGRTAAIKGETPKRIVINSFDSLEQAVAAYNSAAYKEVAKIGSKYGTFRIYAVEGLSR
jgi:uncharacterized protein (DUF1330 family)